jgi:AraC family transcriptional regulator of adaptative response/methylated-DNA-[protein]-cysteine methyltransferase
VNDYERIARIIRHLDEHRATQPSLRELAAVAGLSESHFHHLFHRWAGVTPKDFLQCLTVEFAKRRLRESASVLETALEAGLSGPGRLHDLLVTLEAASPGEFKQRGAGMRIHWGFADSPFGRCSLGWNARGICHLAFYDSEADEAVPDQLTENWSAAELVRDDSAQAQANAIFNRDPARKQELRAFVRGTPFQLKVWRALLRIPSGSLTSYGGIARTIGVPGGGRAVGTACGHNPIAFLIPCHRVIRETGIVQGYRWGTLRKRALLAREAADAASATH